MQTNKDELREALDMFYAYTSVEVGSKEWNEHFDKYGQTFYESLAEAAQAHLSLLDDIQALIEARDDLAGEKTPATFETALVYNKFVDRTISKWKEKV